MRHRFAAIAYALLLMVTVAGGIATAIAAATLPLGNSEQLPAAQGAVRVHSLGKEGTELAINVRRLPAPQQIRVGSHLFVVWARGTTPGAKPVNLGALRLDGHHNGDLQTSSTLTSFELFLTCEQNAAAIKPTSPELMAVQYQSN